MELALIGKPGAGKTTQARMLASASGMVHLSTGEIVRSQLPRLPSEAQRQVLSGGLAPETIVRDAVRGAIRAARADTQGFVLDGFPRTLDQAHFLLHDCEVRSLRVIYLDLPDDSATARITGADLQARASRPDDTPEALVVRISGFHKTIADLLSWYQSRNSLTTVDATHSIRALQETIRAIIAPKTTTR